MNKNLSFVAEIAPQFALYGDFETAAAFGNGHINDTFVSVWNQAGLKVRYLHQRINHRVFLHPEAVMENIQRVTEHIARKLKDKPDRSCRTLTVVPARDGKPYVMDREGGWWRTYLFIEGTHSLDAPSSPAEARFLGKSIAAFQKLLADLPPPRLQETIPDFHNMEVRYRRFYQALDADAYGRVQSGSAEIAFMRENEDRGGILVQAMKTRAIPERICHNDTKMNNILLPETGDAVCVGDLDTVMPGTPLFDVGDLVRTVCTSVSEEEQDLAKVRFDLNFMQALFEGYLSEASEFLTAEEKKLLLEAGRNITQIMGLRFLTDYLEGDRYYHTAREGHNLDRCRNQIALIRSMDAQWRQAETVFYSLI
ncbi:MAG: aminoglycoside phosphotransferase family protein [Spirochaetaceae bacterium]|nr:aminoglycoside phosphotransferase family protein [Spirochaetaceae bacterium]